LIELLVVCAILVVISSLIIIDNNKFGGEVLLENLTYDVALSVRQAQVYGIAVERFGTGSTAFQSGYGMHFAMSSPTTYVLFADTEATGVYDPNASPSELVQLTDITQGFSITKLCAPAGTNSSSCNSVSQIDILFIRPEPDAYISANAAPTFSGGRFIASALQPDARIVLLSPKGDILSVLVEATGQISVQ
jgi:hypothetical protein